MLLLLSDHTAGGLPPECKLVKKSLRAFFDSLRILRAVLRARAARSPWWRSSGPRRRTSHRTRAPAFSAFLAIGVAIAATTISSAPAQPTTVGTLTSGNTPGAQLPSMSVAGWSCPDRPAPPQSSRRPDRTPAGAAFSCPAGDIAAVPDGNADVAQQGKDHQRRCRC